MDSGAGGAGLGAGELPVVRTGVEDGVGPGAGGSLLSAGLLGVVGVVEVVVGVVVVVVVVGVFRRTSVRGAHV